MPKTISQVLGFVDQMIPNAVDTTTKMIFIEDIFKDIREYNTEYVVSDTTPTASSQATYSLPTGIRWKDLIFVGISPTTFNTSNVVASTYIRLNAMKKQGCNGGNTHLHLLDLVLYQMMPIICNLGICQDLHVMLPQIVLQLYQLMTICVITYRIN
jgi:hypothetical protein